MNNQNTMEIEKIESMTALGYNRLFNRKEKVKTVSSI